MVGNSWLMILEETFIWGGWDSILQPIFLHEVALIWERQSEDLKDKL